MTLLPKWAQDAKKIREAATPGPWLLNEDIGSVHAASGESIATAGKYADVPEEFYANAQLIAQAPETQARLERALEVALKALKEIADRKGMTNLHDCCVTKSCTPIFDDNTQVGHCAFQFGVNRGFDESAEDAKEALAQIHALGEEGRG